MHDRKSSGCLEETVSRNTDIKSNFSEGSGRRENYTESPYNLKDYIYHHEWNVARNRNIKGTAGKALKVNYKHAMDIGGKAILIKKWWNTWLTCILPLGRKKSL